VAPTRQLVSLTLAAPAPFWGAALVGIVIVLAAFRAGSLTRSGAAAAFLTGIAALLQSWGTGLFLIVWFVFAAALSRFGRARKRARTAGMLEKDERRDALQVLSNGGVFTLSAVLLALDSHFGSGGRHDLIAIGGVAALIAAGADTWATEFGILAGGRPWSLRERKRVAVGTSGAVTMIGTAASVTGAWLLAVIASLLSAVPREGVVVVAVAGFVGAIVDTLVGAWLQARRWCPACKAATEQPTHVCGTRTALVAGARVLTNDAVNFVCTISGAALAMLLWWLR
jgi:uncharacterized protein (TIGR00297 family)